MGMFDYISVADKLPVSKEMKQEGFDKNAFVYQTKSLENCMSNYIIQGKKLFRIEGKQRLGEEATLIHLKTFHGVINFYTGETIGNFKYWIEYEASFTKGKLTSLKLVKFTKEDDSANIKSFNEYIAKLEADRKLWRNRFFFHTRPISWVRRKITVGLYAIERGANYLRSVL